MARDEHHFCAAYIVQFVGIMRCNLNRWAVLTFSFLGSCQQLINMATANADD